MGLRRRSPPWRTRGEYTPADPAFANPTKPVGPIYDADKAARLAAEHHWIMGGAGERFRRLVPSPHPLRILEIETIRMLVERNVIVVCAGGGGIPVAIGADGAVRGVEAHHEYVVEFMTRQWLDMLSPSNFPWSNPEVLRETLASGGQNLVKGLNNLLADLEKGAGQLRISMTDESAFRLGKNVAGTPGKVVFQTDLMQLIQFQPPTQEVFRRPLLIIPPWINKYYILDLRESNSFIRWALGQGHTVFVVSWVNPDKRLADKGFEDYMLEGSLAAIDAVSHDDVRAIAAEVLSRPKALAVVGPFDDPDAFSGNLS